MTKPEDDSKKPPGKALLEAQKNRPPSHAPRIEGSQYLQYPVTAIQDYLSFFDDQGRLIGRVPRHLSEALAIFFGRFFRGESLESAFGGKTASQRRALQQTEDDYEVLFDYVVTLEEAQDQKQAERAKGTATKSTPSEVAAEQVAARYKMGADNVKNIVKKSMGKSNKSGRKS